MNTVMNVNEAKSNFSGLLSFVHKDRTTVTIMRYGHPIAQIVPCPQKRSLRKDPLLSQIKINGDLFEDDSSDWEDL
jgi:antitoxin (DNA-binding transcriptional repressor) of toxin-antitoxin stability system